MCKKGMCCLDINIAARFVGVLGLFISVIVMGQLITEMSSHEGRGKVSILLGIDIDEFVIEGNSTALNYDPDKTTKNSSTKVDNTATPEPNYFIVACFLFALAQTFGNAVLIWATIVEKRWYTVPWFMCETISLIVQVVGFAYYIRHKENDMNTGVLIAALTNIVVSIYFWCIVFRAQENWNREESFEDVHQITVKTKTDEETPNPPPPPPKITVINEAGVPIY